MKIKILLGLAIVVVAASCKSKSAFNYSESIVAKERSLVPQINQTEDKAKKYFAGENYDSLAIVAGKMEDEIEQKIKEIETTPAPDVKEGENFKSAAVKYFRYLKSIYTSYKTYGLAPSDDARETARTNMISLVNDKQNVLDAMHAAQQKFADANGFRIEDK